MSGGKVVTICKLKVNFSLVLSKGHPTSLKNWPNFFSAKFKLLNNLNFGATEIEPVSGRCRMAFTYLLT